MWRRCLLVTLSAFLLNGLSINGEARAVEMQLSLATATEPQDIVTAIYQEAMKNEAGGDFVLSDDEIRQALFSHEFLTLFQTAQAKVPSGDVGPIDFDPVTNSQDPDLDNFAINPGKGMGETMTITAQLIYGKQAVTPPSMLDRLVQYDFIREGSKWKIADIRGATNAKPWSLQKILASAAKP